jgi:Flp pilus assembly protein TadG
VRRPRGDDGNALVEFTYLAVLLMVPLVYVLTSAFLVQRAAFGVTEAARQAGRAYATADSPAAGEELAAVAARTALADQGITDPPTVEVECPDGTCLAPGSRVRVRLRYEVELPVLSVFLPGDDGPVVPVTAVHTEVVDRFRTAP